MPARKAIPETPRERQLLGKMSAAIRYGRPDEARGWKIEYLLEKAAALEAAAQELRREAASLSAPKDRQTEDSSTQTA